MISAGHGDQSLYYHLSPEGSGDFERNHMVNFVEKVVVIHRGEKRKIVSRCGHV